jgi:hypothetical protein
MKPLMFYEKPNVTDEMRAQRFKGNYNKTKYKFDKILAFAAPFIKAGLLVIVTDESNDKFKYNSSFIIQEENGTKKEVIAISRLTRAKHGKIDFGASIEKIEKYKFGKKGSNIFRFEQMDDLVKLQNELQIYQKEIIQDEIIISAIFKMLKNIYEKQENELETLEV